MATSFGPRDASWRADDRGPAPGAATRDDLQNASLEASGLDRPFNYTTFKNFTADQKQEHTGTLRTLASEMRSTTAPTKNRLPWVKLAVFGDKRTDKNSLRHDGNVETITGIEADYDGEVVAVDEVMLELAAAGILAMVYTSPSHTKEKPRLRVICPTSRPLSPTRRGALVDRLNGVLDGIFAAESWTLSQAYFFGSVNHNQDHEVRLIDGAPIDLLDRLDAGAIGKPGAGVSKPGATKNAPFGVSVTTLTGPPPAAFASLASRPAMNAAALAGLSKRFEDLPPDQMLRVVREILANPAVQAKAERMKDWLAGIYGVAHVAHLAPGLHELMRVAMRAWSRHGPSNKSDDKRDDECDAVFAKFDPHRAGGATVATLLGWFIEANGDLRALLDGTTPVATTVGKVIGTGAPPPQTALPQMMDPATAGHLLNQLYGFARSFNGPPSLYQRQRDGSLQGITRNDLSLALAPYKVRVPDGTGTKLISADMWWLGWINRHTVDRVLYDPENALQTAGEKIENTWRGIAITPRAGSWRRLRWHLLHVICSGNKAYFKFLVRWLAFAVQRPGTSPGSMVVIRSDKEGLGKSTVSQVMLRIFGPHGHEASGVNEVTGDFNDALVAISFLALEEAQYPGGHKHAAAIKNLITSKDISVNPKGKQRYSLRNMLHIMMTTNEQWAVPAGADARRFFVLDVTRKEDPNYFKALWAEIESGGVGAMLRGLLAVGLVGFSPNNVPATAALRQQQRLSADDFTQWITDAIIELELVPGLAGGGFSQTVSGAQLFNAYEAWMRSHGRRLETKIVFGRAMRALGIVRRSSNNRPTYTVPAATVLLTNANERAGIRA